MATDAIILADKLPDIIKKWIIVIPMIVAFLGSTAGIYQTYSKGVALEEAEAKKNKAVHEVATAFQATLMESEPKPKPKPVTNIYKTDCNQCKGIMEQIVNEATKNHVDKSH